MGAFTNKERKIYQNICRLTESATLNFMQQFLVAKYGQDNVTVAPSYVMARGNIPVILIAHADTVFKQAPTNDEFYYDPDKDVIWNPWGAGADDRAGIYSINYIIRTFNLKPHIIITTGEECGCVGAGKLIAGVRNCPWDACFMIQLDRRGKVDSVYYDCANIEFERWINNYGFVTNYGSYTDISIIAPTWKIAAVNLSIGYVDEHQFSEHLHVDWMYDTINKVVQILRDVKKDPPEQFVYIENKMRSVYSPYLYDFDDDDDCISTYPCANCKQIHPIVDMVPLYQQNTPECQWLCVDCYSEKSDTVVWCKECNKGYYLPPAEFVQIHNPNEWMCKTCKENQVIKFNNISDRNLKSKKNMI